MKPCIIFILTTLLVSISPTTQQPNQLSPTDLNALHQLTYTLTDVKNGHFFSTWNFTSPDNINIIINPCYSFSGVTCAVVNGQLRVVALYLGTGLSDSPGLAGTISEPALYQLTELTQLILYPGIVTGFIPDQIGHRLINLRVLSLTNNRLVGPIPESISGLQRLHTLDLSHNKLTGIIPPAITTSLPDLRVLVLSYNNLSGEIPGFFDESRLIHLDLRNNILAGNLPEDIPTTLRYLSLSSNGLWGPIKWVSSSHLVYLDLSMNKLSGPIPDLLFSSSLTSMYLQRNNLSGEVVTSSLSPPLYGPGSTIDLSHNFLSGTIPGFLAGVETLYLNNNGFIGQVPEDYVTNVFAGATKTMYLQHNYITLFPMEKSGGEMVLPDGVALCLRFNCIVPPAVGLTACPARAGGPVSRPLRECSVFNSGNMG